MRRTLRLACTIVLLAVLPAGSVLASRTASSGRALPHPLALDVSNALDYPGSVGMFDPQILIDKDLVLGLAGRSLRMGYLDDGGTHALLVASPKGWGLSLGFRDRYSDTQHYEEGTSGKQYYVTRDWERMFLVGLGVHRRAKSGRSCEAVLFGKVTQGEQGSDYRGYTEAMDPDAWGQIWKSGPGLGMGLRLRTITGTEGLLLAMSGEYLDRRPEGPFPMPANLIERRLTGVIGWRFPHPGLDDLVLAANLAWSDIHDLSVHGNYQEYTVRRDDDRTFSADLRISGERKVLPTVVVRAGAWAPFSYSRSEMDEVSYGFDYIWPTRHDADKHRLLDSPGVSVGAGWRHAPFTFDVLGSSSLSLDYLFARWALTFDLR